MSGSVADKFIERDDLIGIHVHVLYHSGAENGDGFWSRLGFEVVARGTAEVLSKRVEGLIIVDVGDDSEVSEGNAGAFVVLVREGAFAVGIEVGIAGLHLGEDGGELFVESGSFLGVGGNVFLRNFESVIVCRHQRSSSSRHFSVGGLIHVVDWS